MQLLISFVAVFLAAVIGGLFTNQSVTNWYANLKKPAFTPPNWLFGPVWTILYILMIICVYLIWRQGLDTEGILLAFILFWIQLAFNSLWSVVFFGMRSIAGGVTVILILWMLIIATIATSFMVNLWAGILLIPYIIWVSLASYLNIGIWFENRSYE